MDISIDRLYLLPFLWLTGAHSQRKNKKFLGLKLILSWCDFKKFIDLPKKINVPTPEVKAQRKIINMTFETKKYLRLFSRYFEWHLLA